MSRGVWLGLIGVLAVGLIVGFLIASPPLPASLQENESTHSQVAVTTEQFSDARTVELSIRGGQSQPIAVYQSGTITAFSCAVDGEVSSGQPAISINGMPILALNTNPPLWRDLAQGMQGDDVLALQKELARLGLPVTPDERYGDETASAVHTLLSRNGVDGSGEWLPLSSLAAIPKATVRVTECSKFVGDRISAGEGVFTIRAPITALEVKNVPSDLVSGQRQLRVGTATAAVDDTFVVPDPAAVDSLATAVPWQAGDDAPTIGAVLELASPVTVTKVPPSALIIDSRGASCITSGSLRVPVQVVSSSLGMSLISFGDESGPSKVDVPARGTTCSSR